MSTYGKVEAELGKILFSMTPHEMMVTLEKILGDVISNQGGKYDKERRDAAVEVVRGLVSTVAIYAPDAGVNMFDQLTHHFSVQTMQGKSDFSFD
jgi:hypothetical protein